MKTTKEKQNKKTKMGIKIKVQLLINRIFLVVAKKKLKRKIKLMVKFSRRIKIWVKPMELFKETIQLYYKNYSEKMIIKLKIKHSYKAQLLKITYSIINNKINRLHTFKNLIINGEL